jgi:signal transduction histidine kinase
MASIFAFDSPTAMLLGNSGAIRPLFAKPECWDEFMLNLGCSGRVQNFECEAVRNDGRKIWISLSARLVCQDARTFRIEGMSEDVTERKTLREQLMQSQKLESIGQLIAGISHEINTPVLFIGNNVLFLKDAFHDLTGLVQMYDKLLVAAREDKVTSELVAAISAAVEQADADYFYLEIPKAIDETLDGIARVGALMNAMKEYSHPGTKEKTPLDLNHAIQSMITVARNEWKNIADLETEFDASLPLVPVLPGEFDQVILNLVVNAAHAIADKIARNPGDPAIGKGVIKVQTINGSSFVEIRIQDTGCGISEKVRTRIFDPFFTTKEIGRGTGQGLTIARSIIVDKHAGSIDFTTEDGKGTTFVIRLPSPGPTTAQKELTVDKNKLKS